MGKTSGITEEFSTFVRECIRNYKTLCEKKDRHLALERY